MAAVMGLAERRFNAGLSPEKLGQQCGVAGKTIRRLEESGERPTPRVAKAIADHFEVPASAIWPISDRAAA